MPKPRRKEFPDFKEGITEFKRLKANFLVYAGNTAVNFFQDRFRQKGWIDEAYQPWQDRKPPKGKKKPRGSLMVVTGRLKNSIKRGQVTPDGVTVGTDVPYAKALNEGSRELVSVKPHKRQAIRKVKVKGSFTGTANKQRTKTIDLLGARHNVKGFTRKNNTPKRQFIGESNLLMRRLEANLIRSLEQTIVKSFK
jgi:phage gpG-like protein